MRKQHNSVLEPLEILWENRIKGEGPAVVESKITFSNISDEMKGKEITITIFQNYIQWTPKEMRT